MAAPSFTGAEQTPQKRMLFFPTKMLACSRTSPRLFRMRSRRPGWSRHHAAKGSATIGAPTSMFTWLLPPGCARSGPGMLEGMAIESDRDALSARNGGHAVQNQSPVPSLVARTIQLAAARAKVNTHRIQRVGGHAAPQHGFVDVVLRHAGA